MTRFKLLMLLILLLVGLSLQRKPLPAPGQRMVDCRIGYYQRKANMFACRVPGASKATIFIGRCSDCTKPKIIYHYFIVLPIYPKFYVCGVPPCFSYRCRECTINTGNNAALANHYQRLESWKAKGLPYYKRFDESDEEAILAGPSH